jgi:hypothetical protein
LVPLAFVLAVAGPASAEVKSATPTGFEVVTMTTISAPADRVYAALGEVGRWWSPSHTFSALSGPYVLVSNCRRAPRSPRPVHRRQIAIGR